MKMTKIAFWRKVKENCEKNEVVSCIGIYDSDCPYGIDSKECKMCEGGNRKKALAYSEAYIKRHEGKSKKKVNVDTVKSNLKGDEHIVPNPDPTPLEIAKIIRDNEYVCLYVWDCTRQCPISNSKTGQLDCSINRKQLIDSYIKANEPACEHLVGDLCGNAFETCNKECLANSEILKPEPVIEPIKFDDPVPEYVYTVTDFGIFQFYVLRFEREWVKRKDNTESLIEKVYAHEGKKESERVRKEVSIDIKDCYSFKDAVAVAKKNWGLK